MEACKAKDPRAQKRLYELYAAAMYNICLRMLNNTHDAEDILQNSFIDVFSKLHYFRFDSSIGAWIKRIVVNNCINYLKKRKLNLFDTDEQIEGEQISSYVEQDQEAVLNVEKIKSAMTQLPDGYRIVFSLYLLEGYDHKEIASILNVSESTSKSQFNRAKKKLRAIILSEENNSTNARPA